jgi:hypothetical protein
MVLRHMVKHVDGVTLDFNPEILKRIHEYGWTFSEFRDDKEVYLLPTPVHRAYLSWVLEPSGYDFQETTLLDFTVQVLQRFKPTQIFSTIRRTGSVEPTWILDRPPEAQYQDEFYRACHEVTSGAIRVSPEFAAGRAALRAGRIDFYISGPKWGVEIMRDEDRLSEHSGRFPDGGSYDPWLEKSEMQDYILLDCRRDCPRDDHPSEQHPVLIDLSNYLTWLARHPKPISCCV